MRIILIFFGILTMIHCQNSDTTAKDDFDPKVEQQAIINVLNDQQSAWNQGDIKSFMDGYWKSDELNFIGSRGVNKGWQETLDNYKKSYPDKATMGRLQFEIIELNVLSPYYAQLIGKYTLYRESDQPSGYFTLLWQKIDGSWVIIADQTCG